MLNHYVPPFTQWGPQAAKSRAICLHGLTSSSQVWCRVAEGLVEQGYFVTAPDLIGHGIARHGSSSNSYTIDAYAKDLVPLLSAQFQYDTVIGHSFGGPIALALVPLMLEAGAQFVHVVLVEPALELSNSSLHEMKAESVDEVTNVKDWQTYMQENPQWQERDAKVKSFGAQTCDPFTVTQVCDQNNPWSFTRLLPPRCPNIKITILASDPNFMPYFTPAEMQALRTARPDIHTIVVRGSSHAIPREAPNVVVGAVVRDIFSDIQMGKHDEVETCKSGGCTNERERQRERFASSL